MTKTNIEKELLKEMKRRRTKKSYKEPLYRTVRFNKKEIELKVYFKDGQFVAEFPLMPQTVFGTGAKIKVALDDAVNQLHAFVNRCSNSLSNGIPLIADIEKAYKYLIEE
jgi:hypothetical protein